MALTGKITMFDVGDGDAILIHLKKADKDLVMVVDCGRTNDYANHMRKPLAALRQKTGKKGPDIVMASHYDADHIAGLIPLMEEYGGKVGELWAHSPPSGFNKLHEALLQSQGENLLTNAQNTLVNEAKALWDTAAVASNLLNEQMTIMLESLGQLRQLERLHPNGAQQVFNGHSVNGWPEIKVLGPTQTYYNTLFPANKSFAELIQEEAQGAEILAGPKLKRMIELAGLLDTNDPCSKVEIDGTPSITATNRASIVFAIDVADQRYLFTGDAGICSFKEIPNWEEELDSLHWLKVPHHGSERNLTREMIDVMKPMYADCSGGDLHLDQHILDCIGRNERSEEVRSTLNNGVLTTVI